MRTVITLRNCILFAWRSDSGKSSSSSSSSMADENTLRGQEVVWTWEKKGKVSRIRMGRQSTYIINHPRMTGARVREQLLAPGNDAPLPEVVQGG